MPKTTIRCACGKEAVSMKMGSSFCPYDVEVETGFHHVMSYMETACWLCPECFERARNAALTLCRLTGTDRPFIGSFLKEDDDLSRKAADVG